MRRDVKRLRDELYKVHAGAKQGFSVVKEELDGHLDSINENSHEIETLASQLASIEAKLDKLGERIDELSAQARPHPYANIRAKLSVREQEVFLIFYTARNAMTIPDVAKRLGLTQHMVRETIFKLIAKNIPLIAKAKGASYELDRKFKELQAKEELIVLDANIKKELSMVQEQ